MSLFGKLKKAGFWQTLEIVSISIIQMIYMGIMARKLNHEDFGIMAIANSIIIFGNIFAEGGFGSAIVQNRNINIKHINAAYKWSFLLGLLTSIICFFISTFLAEFFDQRKLIQIIQIISLNFLFLSINGVSTGMLQKNYRFKEKFITILFSIIISYSIGIFLAYKNLGVLSLVYASLIFSFLKSMGFLYFTRFKLIRGFQIIEFKELFSFSFGVIILKTINFLSNNGIILILGKIFTVNILGLFERSNQIKNIPANYLGNILDSILYPTLSEIQNEDAKLFIAYKNIIGVIYSIFIPLTIYLIIYTKEIVLILLGGNWDKTVLPLKIMFIITPFIAINKITDSLIRAKGIIYLNIYRKIIYLIILLISVCLGAFYWELVGAAIALTLSGLINLLLTVLIIKKILSCQLIEITIKPMLPGLKISLFIIVLILFYNYVVSFLHLGDIIPFILFSLINILIFSIIIFKAPFLFGSYINYLINKIKYKGGITN